MGTCVDHLALPLSEVKTETQNQTHVPRAAWQMHPVACQHDKNEGACEVQEGFIILGLLMPSFHWFKM